MTATRNSPMLDALVAAIVPLLHALCTAFVVPTACERGADRFSSGCTGPRRCGACDRMVRRHLAADAARAAAAPRAAGESGWRCGFVEYSLTAAIYPDDLSRESQLALGARVLLLLVDAGVYAFVMRAGGAIVVAERS